MSSARSLRNKDLDVKYLFFIGLGANRWPSGELKGAGLRGLVRYSVVMPLEP
jgi:hypothetical protein